MASGNIDADKAKAFLEDAVQFIFSWVLLLPISVIVSGKLLGEAFSYKVDNGDEFKISFKIFTIKAEKSEVMTGFGLYMLIFLLNMVFFSETVGRIIASNAGLSITRWNSLCIFSALCSAAVSMLTFMILVFIPRTIPTRKIISYEKETEMLRRIENKTEK